MGPNVSEALLSDTVIYAPALESIANEGGSEGFEHRLAAMCGLLIRSGDGSPRVILVAVLPSETPIPRPASRSRTHLPHSTSHFPHSTSHFSHSTFLIPHPAF